MTVTVHRFDDIEAFHARVAPYLLERELHHILPLGLTNMWRQVGTPAVLPYLGCAEIDGQVAGAMLCQSGFRVVVSYAADSMAVRALADDLHSTPSFAAASGAMGGQTEVKVFVDQWSQLTDCTAKLNRAERIYRLDRVTPVTGVSGHYRTPTEADYELIVDWMIAFEHEADPAATNNYRPISDVDEYVFMYGERG